jgi:ABC-type phosphate/phosphonate transport system substrate-binding protein
MSSANDPRRGTARPHTGISRSALFLLGLVTLAPGRPAGAANAGQEAFRIPFVSARVGGAGIEDADRKLWEYLGQHLPRPNPEVARSLPYADVLRFLLQDPPFVARTTPYTLIAAEMLGGDFRVLATYARKNGDTTYRSYLAVNRRAFQERRGTAVTPPSLDDVKAYLKALQSQDPLPAFAYHQKLSASSVLLPSFFLRANGLRVTPMKTASVDASLAAVAQGRAVVTATWDVGMESARPEIREALYFVELPEALPNDLLVWANPGGEIGDASERALRKAIAEMPAGQIGGQEIYDWKDIDSEAARPAKEALSLLRSTKPHYSPPALVRVQAGDLPNGAKAARREVVIAARRAVRRAIPHFDLFQTGVHKKPDYDWILAETTDGTVILESRLYDQAPEEIPIPFTDFKDLTQRFLQVMTTRLTQVRYVWPFGDGVPIFINDLSFDLPAKYSVQVQRTVWPDLNGNLWSTEPFSIVKCQADVEKVELPGPYPADLGTIDPDPFSSFGYRVLITPPPRSDWRLAVLGSIFTFSLLGSGILAVVAHVRTRRKSAGP